MANKKKVFNTHTTPSKGIFVTILSMDVGEPPSEEDGRLGRIGYVLFPADDGANVAMEFVNYATQKRNASVVKLVNMAELTSPKVIAATDPRYFDVEIMVMPLVYEFSHALSGKALAAKATAMVNTALAYVRARKRYTPSSEVFLVILVLTPHMPPDYPLGQVMSTLNIFFSNMTTDEPENQWMRIALYPFVRRVRVPGAMEISALHVFFKNLQQFETKGVNSCIGAARIGHDPTSSSSAAPPSSLAPGVSAASAAAAAAAAAIPDAEYNATVADPLPVSTGGTVYIANSTITWPNGQSIGLGLFAGRDFRAGQYITWYYGRREIDTRQPGVTDPSDHKMNLGYGWTSDGTTAPFVIDATHMPDGTPITNPAVQLAILQEGGAGWANDVSYKAPAGMVQSLVPVGAINNAQFIGIRAADGNPRDTAIYLQAVVDIPRNTEIFADYGTSYHGAPSVTGPSAAAYSSSSSSSSSASGSRGRKQARPRKLAHFEDVPVSEAHYKPTAKMND